MSNKFNIRNCLQNKFKVEFLLCGSNTLRMNQTSINNFKFVNF